MARKTAAESARAAVDKLLERRAAAALKLEVIDAEIAELQKVLGVIIQVPAPVSNKTFVVTRPLMAGEGPREPVDPNAPKKSLQELMAEAAANPVPAGLPPDQRPPFEELTQDAILSNEGGERLAGGDQQGAGRWI